METFVIPEEPKSTKGIAITDAARLIRRDIISVESAKDKPKRKARTLYKASKTFVVDDPESFDHGREMRLVHMNVTTPDLHERALALLKHAIQLHKDGEEELAELYAQDATQQVLTTRIRSGNYVPENSGALVEFEVEVYVPQSGANEGVEVVRIKRNSITEIKSESITTKAELGDVDALLAEAGIVDDATAPKSEAEKKAEDEADDESN